MFIGHIGKERVFYVEPSDMKIHLPSDLSGFTPLKYNITHPNRKVGGLYVASNIANKRHFCREYRC